FGVGKNRFAEGKRLEAERAVDIFLLDDGFQHLELARDLDILLLDASRPMRGEPLLPAGRLREPLSAMSRANVVLFTRTEVVPGAPEAVEKLTTFARLIAERGSRRDRKDTRLHSSHQNTSSAVS